MKYRRHILIGLLAIVLLFVFVNFDVILFMFGSSDIKGQLEETRQQVAFVTPEFDGNISDVRFSVVKRDIEVSGEDFKDLSMMQIYYGYCMDGRWYDLPCENFDLRGILNNSGERGYDAAGKSNLVKLGPYLLVTISLSSYQTHFERYNEITDNMQSVVYSITEYYTSSNREFFELGGKCGFLKENVRHSNSEDYEYIMYNTFEKWYYVILEYDKIPKNYEMKIVTHTNKNGVDDIDEDILTYQDIQDALA